MTFGQVMNMENLMVRDDYWGDNNGVGEEEWLNEEPDEEEGE